MSEILKPLMLDETGKAIVEALTQQDMTQTRIEEINTASNTAKQEIKELTKTSKQSIETKTNEQLARIPEVTELSGDVNQLKDDVAAITPDDTVVDGKPWTSKKTVDSLCMPLEATGNPVQVYPVEGYPLGIKVSWEPTQAGEGDPSPDNIRPISGRDAVRVIRCGKNYIDVKSLDKKTISSCKYESTEKGFRVTAYAAGNYKPCIFYLPTDIVLGKTITVSAELTAKTNDVTPGIRIIAYKDGYVQQAIYVDRDFGSVGVRYSDTAKIPDALPEGCEGFALNYYCTRGTNANPDDYSEYADIQIELGSTATPYEPYTGSKTDIALPETVYGGTLDVETGVVTVTHCLVTLTGEEIWQKEGNYIYSYSVPAGKQRGTGVCTHYPYWDRVGDFDYVRGYYVLHVGCAFIVSGGIGSNFTVDEWKAHLAEQKANGTPVQVSYALKTPYTIQLTPQQIAALSGVNIIYTDAGTLTVTGREDPRHTIVELKNAIISLGGNI